MKNTIIARRYAKALFIVSKEEGSLDDYTRSLADFAQLYAENPEVVDVLTNPVYPMDVRSKVMEHLVKATESSQVMSNFMNLLVHKKRAGILPDIAEQFNSLVDEDRNICQGTVISAMELTPDLQDKVQAMLEKITGKQVVLETQVDPAIIGGLIAKVGDLVLDGCLKTQLAGLKESIKGSDR